MKWFDAAAHKTSVRTVLVEVHLKHMSVQQMGFGPSTSSGQAKLSPNGGL
jgi:hypothetical protein